MKYYRAFVRGGRWVVEDPAPAELPEGHEVCFWWDDEQDLTVEETQELHAVLEEGIQQAERGETISREEFEARLREKLK